MPLHLSIPQHRRDRATHEKARSLRPGELRWTRWYTDDLDDLAGEPVTVRFLDEAIVKLASKRGWTIPYDARRIANRLELRPTDTSKALKRLLALHRLELVEVADKLSTAGNVQIGLDLNASHSRVSAESVPDSLPSQRRVSADSDASDHQSHAEVTSTVSAQIEASLAASDPNQLTGLPHATVTRQEQTRAEERSASSNGTVVNYAAAADAQEREIVNRLIGLVARGRPQSIAVIRYECAGLPDSAVARAIESVRTRTPRPSNSAGYAVQTLRAIRHELGLPDPRPRIDREPAVGDPR